MLVWGREQLNLKSKNHHLGCSNSYNVPRYLFGFGSFAQLDEMLKLVPNENSKKMRVVYCIDHFFKGHERIKQLPIEPADIVLFIDTTDEPKTDQIDSLVKPLREFSSEIKAIVGMGGGATLDTTKAISNLLTNPGNASDYQGWDLVKNPGIYKIGIPTLSGTGSESSKTCVMTNKNTGVKLGMNSPYSVFDQLILDPDLTKTVPREQYFYTAMDTYVHCVESLAGRHRNAIGDAFSHQALLLCQSVFSQKDIQGDQARADLMVASYLGGCAIANSFVGLVHPLSAGLSVVFGMHHCVANCVVMNVMQEFYPRETDQFHRYLDQQNISLPTGVARGLEPSLFEALYQSSIVHEKPLKNALGEDFKKILTLEKVSRIYELM